MTFHPQGWTGKTVQWGQKLILQNVKNIGKFLLIKLREQYMLMEQITGRNR